MHDFNYISFLIVFFTLVGAACIVLLTWWLLSRVRLTTFRKITIAFICAGVIVPVVILPIWFWNGNTAFESVAVTLWPTSIELMVLSYAGRDSWISDALVYGISILGNIGVYGVAGIILGGIWNWIRSKSGASWHDPSRRDG